MNLCGSFKEARYINGPPCHARPAKRRWAGKRAGVTRQPQGIWRGNPDRIT
jgi:hypothetical protein